MILARSLTVTMPLVLVDLFPQSSSLLQQNEVSFLNSWKKDRTLTRRRALLPLICFEMYRAIALSRTISVGSCAPAPMYVQFVQCFLSERLLYFFRGHVNKR